MLVGLTLDWWHELLFWPGMTFMDWLARTWPDAVIRYNVGFTVESYLYWSMLISVVFWSLLLIVPIIVIRRLRSSRGGR